MKIKFGSLVILLFFISSVARSQVELTPFGGYIFDATFSVTNGKGTFLASPAYGLNVLVPFKYNEGAIDITYQRQDTKIAVRANDNINVSNYLDTIETAINYILVGGVYEFGKSKKVVPYGGINVGLGIIANKEETGSINPFTFGFKAGLKLFASDRIGFRLQSELNIAMLLEGSGFGCAISTSGNSCGFVVYSTTSVGQFGLTGGLIFKLQKQKKEDKQQIGL